MFRYLAIDTAQNMLLCDGCLVGIGELVEIHQPDADTPPQAGGKILKKLEDPGLFMVQVAYDGHESIGKKYTLGSKCVLRVVSRNLSGKRRRKCHDLEQKIVDVEKQDNFKERKVSRAKTGSVRKSRNNPQG